MTSTKFNIGMTESRNSSRVLKPPGGGHTDFFAAAEPAAPKKDNRRNASSISEGRNAENVAAVTVSHTNATTPEAPAPASVQASAPIPTQAPVADSTPSQAPEAPKAVNGAPKTAPSAAPVNNTNNAASRGKVPPGGFSSGFW